MSKDVPHASHETRARVLIALETDRRLAHEQYMTRYLLGDMWIDGRKLDDIAIMDASIQRSDVIEG